MRELQTMVMQNFRGAGGGGRDVNMVYHVQFENCE